MNMNSDVLIKPKPLMPGDTIGIVAPAGPFERETFDRGFEVLQCLGYSTRLADGLFNRRGYLAGDDNQRLAQLNAMLVDPGIDAIMCARGGFGAMKIISHLDYVSIRRSPKAFIGFSDITALHQALFQRLGLVTFHGPMVTTLADADDASLASWSAWLAGEAPKTISSSDKRTISSGQGEGVVLGGNLATLCHLVGTDFSPAFNDAILIIEEINEPLYRIDRMLTQMKLAGCFHGLAGVVVGDFSGCGSTSDLDRLLGECFRELAVPMVAGFAFGHSKPNLTLPLGVRARLNADSGELRFLESAVDDGR
jgi:muramoyltetrapeptide carboxypeptidase